MSTYKPPHRRFPKSPSTDEAPTGSRIDARQQSSWRSGNGSASASASTHSHSPEAAQNSSGQDNPEASFPQHVLAGITSENAQSLLPPSACVFVAK